MKILNELDSYIKKTKTKDSSIAEALVILRK